MKNLLLFLIISSCNHAHSVTEVKDFPDEIKEWVERILPTIP
jgi:hypothetical protein